MDRKFCSYCGQPLVEYVERFLDRELIYKKCSVRNIEFNKHDFFRVGERKVTNKYNPYTGEKIN